MINTIFAILLLLQVKHLIIDWIWQPAYEHQNKGIYGHWGGIRHALKHALGTAQCFIWFVPISSISLIFVIDFCVHYHIDWAKVNLSSTFNTKDPQFWWLTGIDQFLHQITYIGLIWMCLSLI